MTDAVPPADPAAVCGAIETFDRILIDSRARVLAGEPVNLSGLSERMAALCDAVARLEDDEARRLVPRLKVLEEGLDALEAALRRAHDATREQTAPRGSAAGAALRRATGAYAVPRPPR